MKIKEEDLRRELEVALSAMFGEMERPIRSNGVSWPLETE